jgi:hypothetical protein
MANAQRTWFGARFTDILLERGLPGSSILLRNKLGFGLLRSSKAPGAPSLGGRPLDDQVALQPLAFLRRG